MRAKWQEGSLIKRGKYRRVWVARYRISVAGPDGKISRRQVERIIGSVDDLSRRQAQDKLHGIIRAVDEGSPSVAVTFGQYTARWREAIAPRFKFSTRRGYESLLRLYLLPKFSFMPLGKIKLLDVQILAAELGKTHKPETTKHVVDLLSGMFRAAVKWGWVRENPCKGVELPQRYRRPQAALDPGSVARLIMSVEEPYATLLLLISITALRRSEIFGLRWRSIDRQRGGISVSEAYIDGHWSEPKVQGQIKFFPLPAWVLDRLEALRENAGRPAPDQPIFATRLGKPVNPNNVRNRVIVPACKKLGIPPVSFHAFRRGTATALIAGGADPKLVQSWLGHSDVQVTLAHYAMLDASRLRTAVEGYAEKLRGNCEEVERAKGRGPATSNEINNLQGGGVAQVVRATVS